MCRTDATPAAPLVPLTATAPDGHPVDVSQVPGWRVVYFWGASCPCVSACERYSLVPLADKYQGRVAHTYLSAALAQALAGKPVTNSTLPEAGCIVAR